MVKNKILWGAATAAYQVEGAVREDGKGLTSWDVFYEKNDLGYDGNIAVDHYNRMKEDVKLFHEIGLETYRFSISWARILPNGSGKINEKGLNYYRNLINELLKYNIVPFVTIYHWDLPQALMDKGGWLNKEIIDDFVSYSKILFEEFGDKVPLWATINEPMSEVIEGYVQASHPPQMKNSYREALQVSHNFNVASARVIKLFRQMKLSGKIGIVLNPMPCYLLEKNEKNIEALNFAKDYLCDWCISPATIGEYPKNMLEYCKSNFNSPQITAEEEKLMKENIGDYLGINYYMRRVVEAGNLESKFIEDKFNFIKVPGGQYTKWDWEIYPKGLSDLLLHIKNEYKDMEIIIAENGMGFDDHPDKYGNFEDDERIDYIKRHIEIIEYLKAKKDINISAYYVWSAIDLLSWTNGYQKRYGLIGVDFDTLERKIKKSGYWYKNFIENYS